MAEKIRCIDCEYCKDLRNIGNARGSFHCEHPNKGYIDEYFKNHNIQKMPGFIAFGKVFDDKPNIKTSPAWCPKKAGGKQ